MTRASKTRHEPTMRRTMQSMRECKCDLANRYRFNTSLDKHKNFEAKFCLAFKRISAG